MVQLPFKIPIINQASCILLRLNQSSSFSSRNPIFLSGILLNIGRDGEERIYDKSCEKSREVESSACWIRRRNVDRETRSPRSGGFFFLHFISTSSSSSLSLYTCLVSRVPSSSHYFSISPDTPLLFFISHNGPSFYIFDSLFLDIIKSQ